MKFTEDICFSVIYLVIILAFAVNVVNCANSDDAFKGAVKVKCSNRTDRKMDEIMAMLVMIGTDLSIPETPDELRNYCNLVEKNMPFALGVFKYCKSSFAQTIAKIMIFPIRKQWDDICKTGKISRQAREVMAAGKCGNLARERLKECNTLLIDALNGIPFAPVKNRIYMTCCHSNAYRQCLRDATEDTVGCTRHTIDWAEKFVLKILGGSVELVCGDYFQESDKCTKLINETPKPQYSKLNRRQKSFAMPLINVMESFPDHDT